MIMHEPQRADPYAGSLGQPTYGQSAYGQQTYGQPAYGQPLQPVQMRAVHAQHNSAAIGSVIVGALAFCLSIVGVVPGAPFFYYSAGGIIAIIGGVRALMQRRRGFGTNYGTPVTAIVLGSMAVILMLIGAAIHLTGGSVVDTGSTAGTVQSQGSAAQNSGGQDGGAQDGVAEGLPSAPTWATDAPLSQYEQTAASVAKSIFATYNGGQVATSVAGHWPASLQETTNGTVLFPSGTAAATIPTDEVLKYELSSDGTYFDIYVSGGNRSEIAIYDSGYDEFTWSCQPGASASCPTGGVDPGDSSGPSGSGSNT